MIDEHSLNMGFMALIVCGLLVVAGASALYYARKPTKMATRDLTRSGQLFLLGLATLILAAGVGIWGVIEIVRSL